MLEHTQLEWNFAQALLPPFMKSNLGDDECIWKGFYIGFRTHHSIFTNYKVGERLF